MHQERFPARRKSANALVVALGAVGLSAWLGWLDFVLLPVLGVCIALVLFAAFSSAREPKP